MIDSSVSVAAQNVATDTYALTAIKKSSCQISINEWVSGDSRYWITGMWIIPTQMSIVSMSINCCEEVAVLLMVRVMGDWVIMDQVFIHTDIIVLSLIERMEFRYCCL